MYHLLILSPFNKQPLIFKLDTLCSVYLVFLCDVTNICGYLLDKDQAASTSHTSALQ